VVFVSAHEEAAVDAFELRALDYLMKPVGRRRVEQAVQRILDESDRHEGPAPLPEIDDLVPLPRARGGATRLLHRAEILYLQSDGDYVRVVADSGRFLVRARLGELEERWSDRGFARVHRGYVANLQRAVEVRPSLDGHACLRLQDGTELPIARRQLPGLRRRLGV
jgi:DNA-binding LytR/AlgR family response regulator